MRRIVQAVVGAVTVGMLGLGVAPAAAGQPEPVGAEPRPQLQSLTDRVAAAASAGVAAEDLPHAVGLPAEGAGSLVFDDAGHIEVTVVFEARPSGEQLVAVGTIARIDRAFTFTPALSVFVAPARAAELNAIPGVVSAIPAMRPRTSAKPAPASAGPAAIPPASSADCRAVPVEADLPMAAAEARERFGVDGTGVTVGIVSDSFAARTAPTSWEQDIALGVLPGPGNPCGREIPVRVLLDAPGERDEGRGMAQLVHGIAPGATLLFAATGNSPESMAESIVLLAQSGADVIVDDMGYISEPRFQQGVISAAARWAREEHGVAYYAATGNDSLIGEDGTVSAGRAIGAWETARYEAAPCPEGTVVPRGFEDITCQDFDPGAGVDATDEIGLTRDDAVEFVLQWAEPLYGVTSAFELQLYEVHGADRRLLHASHRLHEAYPIARMALPELEGRYELVLVRDGHEESTPDTSPAVWMSIPDGKYGLAWREHNLSEGDIVLGQSSYGHPVDGSSVGVGAVRWSEPGIAEGYSSIGPGIMHFEPVDPSNPVPSPALPEPQEWGRPFIAGADGIRTSFFGSMLVEHGETVYRFHGTSAAAPHVAAVHALALDYLGERDHDAITRAMAETAREVQSPVPGQFPSDLITGSGLADAAAALAALPGPPVPWARASAPSSSSVTAAWGSVRGVSGYLVSLRLGDDVVAERRVGADVLSLTFDDASPDTAYRVAVSSIGASGVPGRAVTSASVTTPPAPRPSPSATPAPTAAPSGALASTGSGFDGAALLWAGLLLSVAGAVLAARAPASLGNRLLRSRGRSRVHLGEGGGA